MNREVVRGKQEKKYYGMPIPFVFMEVDDTITQPEDTLPDPNKDDTSSDSTDTDSSSDSVSEAENASNNDESSEDEGTKNNQTGIRSKHEEDVCIIPYFVLHNSF